MTEPTNDGAWLQDGREKAISFRMAFYYCYWRHHCLSSCFNWPFRCSVVLPSWCDAAVGAYERNDSETTGRGRNTTIYRLGTSNTPDSMKQATKKYIRCKIQVLRWIDFQTLLWWMPNRLSILRSTKRIFNRLDISTTAVSMNKQAEKYSVHSRIYGLSLVKWILLCWNLSIL